MIDYARALVVIAAAVLGAALGGRPERAPAPPASPGIYAPLGEPLPGTSGEARARFERGKRVAERRFAASEGLGPAYNAVACASCHEKPVTGGGASRYRAVYVTSSPKPEFKVPFERRYTTDGVAPGGEHPRALRTPPPFFGAGLLAEIPAEEILARADPSDRDGDGIRGKVNFERGFIGRFGRKAQMASLQGFVRLALLDHMGITSNPLAPDDARDVAEGDAPVELRTVDADGAADPELGAGDLRDLLAFVALLAPPAPDPPTDETRAGEALFARAGCAACHAPSLRGPRGPVAAYTDLLLHDMGPELADGVAVGEAKSSEFRTAPLWGLAAMGPFLHDGRADTVDDAIRAHGGEAARARARYVELPARDKARLLAFLASLGGSAYEPRGMLAKGAPVARAGLGAPRALASADDAARFSRGRALFDHDFARSEGLGPRFNGDACRSCHFDPVIGGAGPADVDVVRHAPAADTMLHHFDLAGAQPQPAPGADVFERRQTPALFGLGLVDAIDDDAIRARADPDDRDGDGVRGAVSVLPDGRVGRVGWKGQIATLREFVADALTNEMGVVPPGAPGAELDARAMDDLAFFVARLAPPARRVDGAAGEGAGAFARLGCAACHAPSLAARDGSFVPLYSDLLLHDVAPPGARTVGDRAFRTPPLWGVARSAPYLHDGRAETLDAAVRAHDGEAARSRDAYARADGRERARLLAFLAAL